MKKIKTLFHYLSVKCSAFWAWYKALYVGRKWYVKTTAVIGTLIVSFFLYLGAVDINLFWLFGKSPGWVDISEIGRAHV